MEMNQVGGLVGRSHSSSTITNSYSTGYVNGIGDRVGGLVGERTGGTINNSFYDSETSGRDNTGKGTPKTTAQMRNPQTFINASWNLSIWYLSIDKSEYPKLLWENNSFIEQSENEVLVNVELTEKGDNDYFDITDCYELQRIKNNLTAKYELTDNITCSMSSDWNNEKGFIPIGNDTNRFTGNFEGNNYTISNLFIDRSSENYVGLFGYTGGGSSIKDVGLINVGHSSSSI